MNIFDETLVIVVESANVGGVYSVNGKAGYVTLDKSDINLSNVENISIIATSGYLQNQINNISGGGSGFTGDYYPNSNPSGFITGDLSLYVTKINGQFTNRPSVNGTGVLLSGEGGSVDLSAYATNANLSLTGSTLNTRINSLSGTLTGNYLTTGTASSTYATITNLGTTGSTLNTRIDSLSGTLTGNYVTKSNGQFTNRPTVNGTGVLLTGDAAEYVFPNNLAVSLSSGKTFGRYINGQIIPASGKTPSQVIQLALVEPITPNVTLTSLSPAIQFNQTGINNILSGNATINSLGASVQTGYIEWRRGGVGAWVQLTGNTLSSFSFTHSLIDSNFNSSGFNYRYIVVDTVGASGTGFANITPIAYAAPTLSSTSVGTSPVDLGNISGTLSTTINRNSQNVNVTGYQLQYQTGVSWINLGSLTSVTGTPHLLSVIHNDSSLINMNSINYRIQVFDQFQSNTLPMGSRSFLYRNYLGYNTGTSLTLAEIEALTNSQLSNSRVRTVPSVTAPDPFYTYYCYRADDIDLTSITDGLEQFIGSFTKLSNVTGTNTFGASVNYKVYKSNATKAFTNVTLSFS